MNMDRKLIIRLIKQDLLHNQLLQGIENLGFNSEDRYHLEIWDIVAELMGNENGESPDTWDEIYYSYLKRTAKQIDIDLNKLASECYQELIEFQE